MENESSWAVATLQYITLSPSNHVDCALDEVDKLYFV